MYNGLLIVWSATKHDFIILISVHFVFYVKIVNFEFKCRECSYPCVFTSVVLVSRMREVNTNRLSVYSGNDPYRGPAAPPCGVMSDWEQMFMRALARPPTCRSLQDLQVIYYGLSGLEALQTLRDSALRALCKVVRYEKHQANDVLY